MSRLLLAIDLQNGWRHKSATEAAMLKTVEICKQFDGDVVHCVFQNDPNSLFTRQLHWKRFLQAADTDEIPEAADLKLKKYWRSTYSCVTDELEQVILRQDHVYIAGVFTDISVTATAMGIFDLGIPVTVVSDCVATLHGQDVHESAIKSLEFAIGIHNVIHADAVPKTK